jgi:hypothetical protein
MDKSVAEKLIELAKAAKVELWFERRPTPEMIERFGEQGLHPFIEQAKQKGEPVGVEILAEDYSGNDELREAHLAFILASAKHVPEMARLFLALIQKVELATVTLDKIQMTHDDAGSWLVAEQALEKIRE